MKKILRIATYDFKRLVLNPITIISMIVVFLICFITGMCYHITPTPTYEANIQGETVNEIYSNFYSLRDDIDTKRVLKNLIRDAQYYIDIQKDATKEEDLKKLREIKTNYFDELKTETMKFNITFGNDNQVNFNYIREIINVGTNELYSFVNDFKKIKPFGSSLYFTNEQFDSLSFISNYFLELNSKPNDTNGTKQILTDLISNMSIFDTLNNLVSGNNMLTNLVMDRGKIQSFESTYINKANEKLNLIEAEITDTINNNNLEKEEKISNLKSLITNYKLTCESSKNGILYELELIINNHFGNNVEKLYNYYKINEINNKVSLSKINHFLEDESLYYTAYQEPLNFNHASYIETAYDHTYFIICIIGFLNILFAIFCAYKLFGLDRRNGKMDVILSQNVTFSQTFAGKFLAIALVTSFMLGIYTLFVLVGALIFYPTLAGSMLAIFNITSAYTIHPFLFLLFKIIGWELQALFYATITIFLMNCSRKFDLMFGISVLIYVIALICNIYCNNIFVYCLFPFIHADLTSFIGGATMSTGFLVTSLYVFGNFFISLAYYLVVVVLFYNLSNQLFKRN